MAQECNNQEAREAYSTKGNSFKVPITNVGIISKIINTLINLPNLPKPPIPRGLIAIGNTFRPGINAAAISANVLNNLSQDGIPTGPLPSGGENLVSKAIINIVDGVVDELLTNARITSENSEPISVITPSGPGTIPPGFLRIRGILE